MATRGPSESGPTGLAQPDVSGRLSARRCRCRFCRGMARGSCADGRGLCGKGRLRGHRFDRPKQDPPEGRRRPALLPASVGRSCPDIRPRGIHCPAMAGAEAGIPPGGGFRRLVHFGYALPEPAKRPMNKINSPIQNRLCGRRSSKTHRLQCPSPGKGEHVRRASCFGALLIRRWSQGKLRPGRTSRPPPRQGSRRGAPR